MQRGYGMNYMNRKSRDKETGIYVVCNIECVFGIIVETIHLLLRNLALDIIRVRRITF